MTGDREGARERQRRQQSDQLARRRQVLGLPMVALRHHAYLSSPSTTDPWIQHEPRAVGIGPDGAAVAVWNHRATPHRRLITRHHAGGNRDDAPVIVDGPRDASFVQPLPDGEILLVDARVRGTAESAEVRDADGRWLRAGHLGDAVGQVLATAGGHIWVGYFDEAAAVGHGLGGHGLVRFRPDLQPDWRYPADAGLPHIDDCYALNVHAETAHTCAYSRFHLVSAHGTDAVDHGAMPVRGAQALVIDGDRAVLVGGYGAEYDLVTPVHVGPDGVHVAGEQSRLVLPDGMEIRDVRWTARGPDLHAVIRGSWYRLDLEAPAAAQLG